MRWAAAGVVLALVGACALLPEEEPPPFDPDDLDAFVESVREDLETHDLQALLSASDPLHYQADVVEERIPEERYLAELFGIADPPNSIQEGDTLDLADFEQITAVTLEAAEGGPPYRLTGVATLGTTRALRLEAWVRQVQGRLVLTDEP